MAERKKRSKIANLESLTLGNCNIALTLDTRYCLVLILDYMGCQFTSSSQEKEKGVRFLSNSLILRRFRMGLNQRPPD